MDGRGIRASRIAAGRSAAHTRASGIPKKTRIAASKKRRENEATRESLLTPCLDDL
jgi:hypothetical protein